VPRRPSAIGCASCPLRETEPANKRIGHRWVAGYGPAKARLVIVGQGPGETEVLTQRPFTGPSGQLLNSVLKVHEIPDDEVYFTNAVMCPGKPTTPHLVACRPRLFDEIKSREPEIVLTLGMAAFHATCETRTNLRDSDGMLWWSETLARWVIPTWHPAAVLRGGADDQFFPQLNDAILRVSRFLRGIDTLPDPYAKRAFKWTFFQSPEGTAKCLTYFENRAAQGRLTIAADTESQVLGRLMPDGKIVYPGGKSGKGRPHPERDRWLLHQMYDGKRAAAINVTTCGPEALDRLARLLQHPNIIWAGHNICTYDLRVWRHNLGVAPADKNVRDTMMLGLGLSERKLAVGLEPLSRRFLNAPAFKGKLAASGYHHRKGPQNEAQWHHLAAYGVDDTYYGYELNRVLPAHVREEGTMELVKGLLMPLALTCGRIAARGMPVDTSQFEKLDKLWGGRADDLTNQLQELAIEAGWPKDPAIAKSKDGRLNPRSHLQLSHLAYDCLGLTPTQGLTNRKWRASKWQGKERLRSVDGDFLLGHENTQFSQLMQLIRIYDKLVKTYVRGLWKEIDPDGLIHPDFDLAGTATGRLVVRPLLQVLPHYGAHRLLADQDFAAETRRLFPARPGYVIVAADFKQLEMRVAAALSADPVLAAALRATDPHAVTARYMFQREEVDDADRHAAKRVMFGVLFNRSAFTLSRGPLFDVLGGDTISDGERQRMAQQYIDSFWQLYHVLYAAQRSWVRDAMTNGELVTPFGRKRRWQLITDQNQREIENQACNFPIQSTASDMMSTALIRLEPALQGYGWPLYTVHDQAVCEIREDKLEPALQIIQEVMTEPMFDTNGVEFAVTFEAGPNLGDVEKIQVAA
jgi:uracil-DNA glycosylase family 4